MNLGVGNTAIGSISVLDGATFSSPSFFLGATASGNGTMTVGGGGASAAANSFIAVGSSGLGVLDILTGGTVSTAVSGTGGGSVHLGDAAGGNGTINVNGGQLRVGLTSVSAGIRVGLRSTDGALNVTNGGRVSIGYAGSGLHGDTGSLLQIGGASGADQAGRGSVLVSGPGSMIELLGENANINVGRHGAVGTSTLTVENGGVVHAGRNLTIGRSLLDSNDVGVPGTGATGVVVVDGAESKLILSGIPTTGPNTDFGPVLRIGRDGGTGTLTIRNGALVQLDGRGATSSASAGSGGATVAQHSASTGTLNIQSGGRLELLSDSNVDAFGMTMGRLGTGTLNVTSGGQLLIRNTGTGGVGMGFGGNTSSVTGGSFSGLISGAGSSVVIEGIDANITVGSRSGSSGTVTIEAGATAAPGSRFSVASNAGSSGTLNIRGAGTVINLKSLAGDEFGAGMSVGRSGNGIASISDGAVVNVDGSGSSKRHTTNVGGTGTGSGGTGVLNISGATTRYNVTGASTSLVVGRDDGDGGPPSTGTMTISGGAQVSYPAAGTGSVGYSPGSSGTLNVTGAGSRLDMGSFLGVGRSYNNDPGGTAILNVADGGVVKAASIHVGTGGTVSGNGTLDGAVINDGAINPGNSPGILSIAGDLTLTDSSVLTFEVAGALAGQYDVIAVGGALSANGTLRVVNTGGYVPVAGDTLNFVTFASRSGGFDSVAFEGFGAGANLVGGFSGGAFQVAAVPEPHEWALLLSGLVLLRFATRRRSRRFDPA